MMIRNFEYAFLASLPFTFQTPRAPFFFSVASLSWARSTTQFLPSFDPSRRHERRASVSQDA